MRPLIASPSLIAPALLLGGVLGTGLVAAPAHADATGCTTSAPGAGITSTDVDPADDAANPALRSLRLDDVHGLATGRGVGVAVIDSGVQSGPGLDAAGGTSYAGSGKIVDGHGTIVAGLIAGGGEITGLAPEAVVVPIRVGSSEPDPDAPQPSVGAGDVAAAIDWAVTHRQVANIRVINLSLGFTRDVPAIAKAVERAVDKGIVVVAAAGDRAPDRSLESAEDDAGPGESPDEVLFPATLDAVIAVTGRDENLAMTAEKVLTGPEIDVSAPVVGLRSMMLDGVVCDLTQTSSSWAAAEVSALAALLLERHPASTPAQVKSRIELTAQGGFRDSATDGHGMIQPYEALTAVLDLARDGTPQNATDEERVGYQASRPGSSDDQYDRGRDRLLWWGVGGGGAVLLGLLLRPLLARPDRSNHPGL